jgi:hypothetical protein
VKSGCNEAFVLSRDEAAKARIEEDCLRPLLRGEHLQPWQATASAAESAILWTHDVRGEPLAALPAAAHRKLLPWRRQLEQRTDGRGGRWWALFRTEAARSDKPRVVWGDIGRAPRALVLRAGDPTVPLNTCYVVRTRSEDAAYAFAVLLNSPVGAAWLGALAEPARGGYRRFLGWTCARFPVPRDWERACALLAPIGREASAGRVTDAWTLTERVLEAYGATRCAASYNRSLTIGRRQAQTRCAHASPARGSGATQHISAWAASRCALRKCTPCAPWSRRWMHSAVRSWQTHQGRGRR